MNEPGRLAMLSPEERRALLAQLLRRKAGTAGSGAAAPAWPGLEAEVVLDAEIRRDDARSSWTTDPRSILLTGATGFVGAFLLRDLLRQTRAEVHCLVRAPDPEEAKKKLRQHLESYDAWRDAWNERIIPLVGDLASPRLGLSEARFERLADEIDTIYHNGAGVAFVRSYAALKPANVLGTHEILRLASRGVGKAVHYVSTLGVLGPLAGGRGRTLGEDEPLDHGRPLDGGYLQSKWVAEKLVALARSRGLPVAVYRPGWVTGESRTGAWNVNDFASPIFAVCVRLGVVPDLDIVLDMTPVDFVSHAITWLSTRSESIGKVFHLANPRPAHLRDVVEWTRSLGYTLQATPYADWRARLIALAESVADGRTRLLLNEWLPEEVGLPRFDVRKTLAALAGSPVACPPVQKGLLSVYYSRLVEQGMLPPPG